MRNIPWLCGGLSVALGAFVLSAWRLRRPQWTAILPGLPPMRPNSAFMAVLAGASLVLLAPVAVSKFRWVTGRICAGAVAVIAALTLGEHVFGIDLQMDGALVASGEAMANPYPVRPSPQAATTFALLGAALLTIDKRTARGKRPSHVLVVVAALMPLIALLAYVFGTAELYGPRAIYPYVGMGILTATALLTLSAGTLAARADDGLLSVLMAEDSGGLAARRLVAWLVALAVATCGIEAGARFGLYAAPIGSSGHRAAGHRGRERVRASRVAPAEPSRYRSTRCTSRDPAIA